MCPLVCQHTISNRYGIVFWGWSKTKASAGIVLGTAYPHGSRVWVNGGSGTGLDSVTRVQPVTHRRWNARSNQSCTRFSCNHLSDASHCWRSLYHTQASSFNCKIMRWNLSSLPHLWLSLYHTQASSFNCKIMRWNLSSLPRWVRVTCTSIEAASRMYY